MLAKPIREVADPAAAMLSGCVEPSLHDKVMAA
jgi:hypothetical protein